jgi:hypothetical protein
MPRQGEQTTVFTDDHTTLLLAIAGRRQPPRKEEVLPDGLLDLTVESGWSKPVRLAVLAARLEWPAAFAAQIARDLDRYGYVLVTGISWFGRSIRYATADLTDDGWAEVKRLLAAGKAGEDITAAALPSLARAGGECGRCGHAHPAVARFCGRCGRPLGSRAAMTSTR